MKKDPTIKIIGISTLVLVGLWLVRSVLFPTGYVRYNMPGYPYYGYNSFNGFTGFFTSIIQVLIIVFMIILIIGIVMLIKDSLLKSEYIGALREQFVDNSELETEEEVEIEVEETFPEKSQPEKEIKICPECGHELDPEWKVCLNCGKELKKSRKRKTKKEEEN